MTLNNYKISTNQPKPVRKKDPNKADRIPTFSPNLNAPQRNQMKYINTWFII